MLLISKYLNVKICSTLRFYCQNSKPTAPVQMKFLNVAEKNDAAKTISAHLSRGSSNRRDGLSVFNKIYEFEHDVLGHRNAKMVMTSVSGHLLQLGFSAQFRNWQQCDPISLFEAPVRKYCPENFCKIKATLEREIRTSNGLIIWTDCDREGENIGFEIIEVCRAVRPNISVYRAKFSEITSAGVKRALANLIDPDERQSKAVDVRTELDLRIGAAFTRFQTMRYQRMFAATIERRLISYGSCQIPTLGFVAKRYKEIEAFVPQQFWKIRLAHTVNELTVEFTWGRNRLFDQQCCAAIYQLCRVVEPPMATVTNVTLKPKSKWRPQPMDTIELEKLGSRKLRLSAKQTMTIAEKLYTQGFISYPRTETNMFSKDIDLRPLVQQQVPHPGWGNFATKVLEWGPNPRNGSKSDQAHPPIHPTKFTSGLNGDEQKVYELIVRHFLACVSRDAAGSETIVNALLAEEEFTATGLCIHERNYLEVYIYDKWNAKEIHGYEIGQSFEPTDLSMKDGKTTAPELLTEAELIAMMDKHGIGTDATHAEHINTVIEREYIGKIDNKYLVPGNLGMGLVEGYEAIDLPLAQPELRAGLEKDLKLICTGHRDPQQVLAEQVEIYRNAFRIITARATRLDESIGHRLDAQPANVPEPPPIEPAVEVVKCIKCAQQHSLALKKLNDSFVLSCLGYPDCRNAIWLSANIIKEATVMPDNCPRCGPGYKKIKFRFKSIRHTSVLDQRCIGDDGLSYITCIVCDTNLQELCDINQQSLVAVATATPAAPNRISTAANRTGGAVTASVPPRRPPAPAPAPAPPRTPLTTNRSNANTAQPVISRPIPAANRPPAIAPIRPVANNQNNARPPSSAGWGLPQTNPQPNRSTNQNNSNSGWGLPPPSPPRVYNNTSSNNNQTNFRPPPPPASSSSSSSSNGWGLPPDVKCTKCGNVARKLTVKKDGPNKGREFYACQTECNFFQWLDAPTSNTGNSNTAGNSGWGNRPGPSTSNFSDADSSNTGGGGGNRSKRKCSACRQEGHTRNKCPRLQP